MPQDKTKLYPSQTSTNRRIEEILLLILDELEEMHSMLILINNNLEPKEQEPKKAKRTKI